MQMIIERIPEMSNKGLAQLWQNAIGILASPEHERRSEAQDVVEALHSEWRRRADCHEWFPWPLTDAPGGNGHLMSYGWPEEGMLRYLGYHVGETNPTPRDERRLILKYIFERDLPPLNDSEYYSQWGSPRTPQRLQKLANTIAALARNAKRRDPLALRRAINDWEDDLQYLRENYYVGFFNFEWPITELL